MAMLDLLVEQIDKRGWLSLSSLYFDNSYSLNVYSSRGYIAYSPSVECFFGYAPLDSTDTSVVNYTYDLLQPGLVGMQQNIIVLGQEHLQHFDIAQYCYYSWYEDDQDYTSYPKIPTEAELDALVKDEATGLYPGTDTLTLSNYDKISAISMYGDDRPYSGAWVDMWKRFYKNHKKFVTMLSTAYGVTDAK